LRDRPPDGDRRGPAGRHLVRRRDLGRARTGQAAGKRRQADRRGDPVVRRTLPDDRALPAPRSLSPFDRVIERRDSDSIKWGKYAGRDILPLWVADMDFAAPPAVVAALERRVAHGVFGYGQPMPALTESVLTHLQ